MEWIEAGRVHARSRMRVPLRGVNGGVRLPCQRGSWEPGQDLAEAQGLCCQGFTKEGPRGISSHLDVVGFF